MSSSATISDKTAIFEAVHGSAPEIRRKGVANPLVLLLTARLMIDHVGRKPMVDRIRRAVDRVIRDDGLRTPDLGGKAKTNDFTRAVIKRLK